MKWYRFFFLSLAICIESNQTNAQDEPSAFSGTVLDLKTMNPIDGALVVLKGTLFGTLTGSDGRFAFSGVTSGMYTLTISAEGYTTFEKSVEIEDSSPLSIYVLSRADQLPHKHTYLGSTDQLTDQFFRYLIPRRADAIRLEYSLFHTPLYARSLYLDGTRLIDYRIPTFAFIDPERAEVAPDPYNPSLGLESSVHYVTPEQISTEANFRYTSRIRGLHSSLMVHRDWSHMYGTLIGTYTSGNNYSDGSGMLQHAGIRSGAIAGRMSISPTPKHQLSGSGGWMKDQTYNEEELQQRTAWLHYRFSQDTGLIRAVHSSISMQELDSSAKIRQQSARVSLRMVPQRNLSLLVGADVYHYTERFDIEPSRLTSALVQSEDEAGIFARVLYRKGALLMEGQARVQTTHHYWGGATILTWLINDEWSIVGSVGRTHAGILVTQSDLGFRWNGLERSVDFKAFLRDMDQTHIVGMTALVRSQGWGAGIYTSLMDSDFNESISQMVTWLRVEATISGPLDLFFVYPEIHGTFLDSPSWVGGSLWMETSRIGGISLRLGIQNVLDGTYAYPDSDVTEPGRSFQVSVSYRP